MNGNTGVRIDKFLWAVRIYKTRGQAISACRMGRILVNGNNVKPSRNIEVNDILTVKKPPVTYTYNVISTTGNRVSAKLVPDFLTDLTQESEKNKLKVRLSDIGAYREKGIGRPTKKERRSIDKWRDRFSDL
ncbi:MAG: RNA-binding S4 domain-containing protein [Bacteroidales bacterium]|nr:RNA-binding S4 domain-containing protein [Bacteroidales bacterium]